MEADGFTQFEAPAQNANGDWFCRTVDKDYDGFYRYLAFNAVGRPYVTTMMTGHEVACNFFHLAVAELQFYYEYHKAPDLFDAIMDDFWNGTKAKPATVLESQTMVFK